MVNVSWELALPLKNILDYGYLIFEKYTENSNIYFVFIVCWALFLEKAMAEGNGYLFQYSCLENPRDGGAWWAAIYGVAQSRTRLK